MLTRQGGSPGDGESRASEIIGDGRIVVIQSKASNLAASASGTYLQILHYNYDTGQWRLVSSTAGGVEGNRDSGHPDITSDNRYVVFHSDATNLGGTGSNQQIFRKDLVTGEVILVSKTVADVEADGFCRRPVISDDGTKVVFESYATNLGGTGNYRQVFLKNLTSGVVSIVSSNGEVVEEADNNTGHPSISSDGRYATFHSPAANLLPSVGGTYSQVFRKDLVSGDLILVSSKADNTAGNGYSRYSTINSSGRYVTFYSSATNLVSPAPTSFDQVYRKDLETGNIDLVSSNSQGEAGNDGTVGWGQNPISHDGRYIAFVSYATNFLSANISSYVAQTYRKDLQSGELVRVSENSPGNVADSWSWRPAMTPDGRYITFYSDATNLISIPPVSGTYNQIYRRDMDYFPWMLFLPKILSRSQEQQ